MKQKKPTYRIIKVPDFFHKKAGKLPGSLDYTGKPKTTKAEISLISYHEDDILVSPIEDIGTLVLKDQTNHWIQVKSLHDTGQISNLGKRFSIHPLVLEDILNTEHLPKSEITDNKLFVTLKSLKFDKEEGLIYSPVSFILTNNSLISFQDKPLGSFTTVQKRLEEKQGKIRMKGTDYLLYQLIDAIVDNYFIAIENIRQQFEEIEDKLLGKANKDYLSEIHELRNTLMFVRRQLSALTKTLQPFIKEVYTDFISENTRLYFRDIYDHLIHLNELTESYKELQNNLVEMNNNNLNNQMNQVMKTLTVIASLFIPLTFLVGIYGMNFEYMPELSWHYGYPVLLGIMVVIVVVLLVIMKRKRWL